VIARFARRPPTLEVSHFERQRMLRGQEWTWVFAGGLVLLAWPFLMNSFWLHLSNLALIAVVGAVGLNLLSGNARLISLGQAALLAVGGFTAGTVGEQMNMPFLVSLLASLITGGLTGLLVGIPSLRLKAIYVAITTLALHYCVTTVVSIYQAESVKSAGIIMPVPRLIVELSQPRPWFYVLATIATLVVLAALNLQRSFLGRRWIAVADHEVAARSAGINVARAKLSAFVISSAFVSLAGALGAYYEGVLSAETYDLQLAIVYLAMIIVGGVGSVLGSILGALFLTFLPYLLDFLLRLLGVVLAGGSINGLHSVTYGALILAFLIFEPLGLAAIWRRLRNAAMLWPLKYTPLEAKR
jgi:branched-chain amino acid transport system permease protein